MWGNQHPLAAERIEPAVRILVELQQLDWSVSTINRRITILRNLTIVRESRNEIR
jgi:hypothetical protein